MVRTCARSYREGTLEASRVKELERLGLVWSLHASAWEAGLDVARAYTAVFGHCLPAATVVFDGFIAWQRNLHLPPGAREAGGTLLAGPGAVIVQGRRPRGLDRRTERDQEVLAERISAHLADTPEELVLGPVAGRLKARNVASAAEAHQRSLDALNSPRYLTLLDSLALLTEQPPLRRKDRCQVFWFTR